MLSSIRVRRGFLIVLLAVGVLSMHGLATADLGNARTPVGAMVDGVAGDSDHGGDTGHETMHAVGELCLWLIVAGIVVTASRWSLRTLRRPACESPHAVDRRAAPPSPVGRSPDVHLIGVALRC